MFQNLYSAFLLSPLLIQRAQKPFKDFTELLSYITSGKYHLVADKGNYDSLWYYDFLRTSNESHFRRLRRALRNNPIILVDTISDALDYVELGNYVYPSQQDQPEMIEAKLRCDFSFIDIGNYQ